MITAEQKRKRHAEHQRQWRMRNPDKAREATRRWRVENRDRCNSNRRKWRLEHKENTRAHVKRFKDKYREKYNAGRKLLRAIVSGKIVKPSCCSQCGNSSRPIHGHHHDYTRPLDVEWLCVDCHIARHAEERRVKCSVN